MAASQHQTCITKVWPDRTRYNNHKAFFFTGKIPRPLDNRPFGTPIYTECMASICFSCRPKSAKKAAASQLPSQQTAMSTWDQAAATTSYAGNTYTTGAYNSYDGGYSTPYQTPHTTGYDRSYYTPYQTPHTTGYDGSYYTPYQTPHTTGYGGANYPSYQAPHTTGNGGANYHSYQTPPLHPPPKTPTTPPPPGTEGNAPEVNQQPPLHLPPIHPEQARYIRNKRGFPDPQPHWESVKRAAYTSDLIWPTEANVGSVDFGRRLQKLIGETMAILQQGLHSLTA